ncbi:MAG: hypothetical protein HON68_01175 [Gammaproteobacteria bacterium]|jgi:flagellar biosynthesis/type III secretory pathway chaperone|nr:hypothetical protein [Gammaproteobacteria bacterium]MBT3490600.1 hypothetical protein [Gammaproteobacteria bacterium]MBT3718048.1 hypothetical protein [Gammaproteobacteria bacterium]MBT3844867.1 hypothetical protein [Gammaproteobacteria bacterium]MBT3891992.1 hypothetical protein [Gammaproteobacteria bacterium]
MSLEAFIAQLSTLLQQQHQLANKLEELLQQEQQLLSDDNPDAMLPIIEQKEQLAKHMSTAQKQILDSVKQRVAIQSDDQLAAALQKIDPTGTLLQRWELLLETAEKCRLLNETIGATINLKKKYTENGLAILRGQIGGNRASVYSKKGVESYSQSSRIIDKA